MMVLFGMPKYRPGKVPVVTLAASVYVRMLLPTPSRPPISANTPPGSRPPHTHWTGRTTMPAADVSRNDRGAGVGPVPVVDALGSGVGVETSASIGSVPYPCLNRASAAREKSPLCSRTVYAANFEYDLSRSNRLEDENMYSKSLSP